MKMKAILTALAAAALAMGAEVKLGKALTLTEAQTVPQVLAHPDALVGKTVQVKGKVTEVCQMMGCWMALTDPESAKMIRVKVNDGDLEFPKDSIGKLATAEGTLAKLTLTKEQSIARAKHEAEEQGRKVNPASIKSGTVIYQIAGTGAVIQE